MNLSEFSVKKPVFAWMALIGVCLFGFLSYRTLGVSQMPDVDFPVLDISVDWEGAAPEVIETGVVDVIEDAVTGVQGLREMSSTARQGTASIDLEFDLDRDIDVALQEVQSKLAAAQSRLPEDIEPPVIGKTNPEDQPIMWVGINFTGSVRDLMKFVDLHIVDQFKTIPGVGEITLGGFIEPTLRIWINPEKMSAYELTVEDIKAAVQSEHVEVPAGELENEKIESRVRVMGEAFTVAEFEKITIQRRGGEPMYRPIPLKEVAEIEDGLADTKRISRINGLRSVGFGIRKQRGANAVEIGKRVRAKVDEIRKQLPEGYEIGINFDSTEFIEESINELGFTLILSGILTALICWVFLGSFSSTMNIVLGIPFSVLGAVFCAKYLGYTLNTFTLLGLSLAIGIIVDDAIMVLENIVRHREMKKGKVEAALDGARQITPAAVVATTAVIAIFLPVIFMEGIMGKFFLQFGVIISIALALSLFEAISFAPMRCAQFLEVGPRRSKFGQWFEGSVEKSAGFYAKVLDTALRNKGRFLAGLGVFFVASLLLLPFMRKEFLPAQDQSMFLGRLKTPVGSSLEFTNKRFQEFEKWLGGRGEVRRYLVAVGGFGGGGRSNEGNVFVTMKRPRERPRDPKTRKVLNQMEFMTVARDALKEVPDLTGSFQDLSTRGFVSQRGFPVEFSIRGSDWNALVETSRTIMEKMKNDPLFADVDTDYREGTPEIQIIPDRGKAFERGVSVSTIASTVNALIAGERVARYTNEGRRYEVRVRVKSDRRTRAEDLKNLLVRNNRGEVVRLSDVVTFVEKNSLLTITRKNRERAITIYSNVADKKSQADALKKAREIGESVLPAGYHIVFSGASEAFRESFNSLLFALWLGLIIAYMVLASQFNHVLHPLTVLLAVPFSISGALIALWMGGQSLNMFSMIGLLLLIGIVKKNSILLVEFTNQLREEGMPVLEALKKACPVRFRPVLMTSVSTVAAALPPAFAMGPGAETRIPMAIAIIGGVTVSTVLTLIAVPCVYEIFAKFETPEFRQKFMIWKKK